MRSWRSRRWCCWAARRPPRCRGAARCRTSTSARWSSRTSSVSSRLRRVRDLGPAVAEAFALAQSGVPGPVFVECPVDLLYDEASIRQWYADAGGKGTALADRALRWYLNRHVRRMFDGSAATPTPAAVQPVDAPQCSRTRSVRAALAALHKAERPLAVIGSQAVVQAAAGRRAGRGRGAAGHSGLPVGHGARPARAGAPAADAPPAPPGPARGRLRAAGRRALRLPARLRQARAPQRDADRRQPQRQGRAAQPPARRRRHRRRRRLRAGAGAAAPGRRTRHAVPAGWPRCARATTRARPRSTQQAAVAGEFVNPIALLRALEREAGDERRLLSPTAATSSPPPATCCTRAARSPGSTRVPSARWAWAPASRSAPPPRGPTASCGSSSATAPAASAWPSSTPSCATAFRSSPSSATTPAGRRSRASR